MAITTISLYDFITDSSDAPVANVTVTLTFAYNQATTSDGLLQPSVRQTTTDSTGKWTFSKVVPTDEISPSNTVYLISIPAIERSYEVAPQSGNGSSQQSTAANVIVNNPLALAPYTLIGPVTVGGNLTVTGVLAAASAAITGAFSAAATTLSGLLTAAAGLVVSGGTGATLNASGDFAARSGTFSSGSGPYSANLPGTGGSGQVTTAPTPSGVGTGAIYDFGGKEFHVKSFGAKGGAQMVSDGAMTNGSNILTSASGLFTAADVGKSISVDYALSATIGPGSGGFGTITAYTSPTSITLSFTCTNATNVTNAEVTWGYDDTVAFRACLAKIAAQPGGRGSLVMGADTYIVCPQTALETEALRITASNLEFRGQSPKTSRLWFRCFQMKNPKTNWTNNGGAVLRGYGFQLISQSIPVPLSNVTFRDFEFDGDAGYTGNNAFPANITTGDGWDITHKGSAFFDTAGITYDNIKWINVHWHSWRGEIIYSGGGAPNLRRAYVYDCEVNDSNGDGLSIGGEVYEKRNQIYKVAGNGIDQNYTARMEITDNYIHDCDTDGIAISTVNATSIGPLIIENNRLLNCQRTGIAALSGYNAWVRYNHLMDCGWFAKNTGAINISQTTLWAGNIKGIHVTDNEMWANAQNLYHGIILNGGAASVDDVEIDRNFVGSTALGVAAAKSFNDPLAFTGTAPTTSRIRTPYGKASTYQYTDQAYVSESLLTTVNPTDVAKQRPVLTGLYRVSIAFRVAVAITNVTINVTYYDAAGTLQTRNVLALTAEAVGSYSMAPVICNAASASEAQYIKVTVTAGTANQVYVSASIQEAF